MKLSFISSIFLQVVLFGPWVAGLGFQTAKVTNVVALQNGHEHESIAEAGDNAHDSQAPLSPLQTAPPDISHAALLKRDHYETLLIASDNTCGYLGGSSNALYSCVRTDYRCNFYLSFYTTLSTPFGVILCCPSTGACTAGITTTCINSADYAAGSRCTGASGICASCTSSAFPYCNGATFPALGLKDYFCGNNSTNVFQTAYTTFSNEFPDRLYITSSYLVTDTASDSSTSSPSTSTSPSSSTDTTSSSASSTTTPPPTPPPSPPPSTPVGAIAGGAVGGAVVLALIGGLIYFYMRKKRKQQQATAPPPPPQPEVQQAPYNPKSPYSPESQYNPQPLYSPQPPYSPQPAHYSQQYGGEYPQHSYEVQGSPPAEKYLSGVSTMATDQHLAPGSPGNVPISPATTVGTQQLSPQVGGPSNPHVPPRQVFEVAG